MFYELIAYAEELRQSFRVVDALDIAVIAVLLYTALVWFKQTASRNVVIGVIVLTVLYFLARTFDMYLTSLVFQTAFAVLLVALVVLFQEDIRRAFERLADWGTLHRFSPKTAALMEETDSLVEAAFTMAGKKIGALIVLRGREPLDRHIDGGIPLSGEISKAILYSIFDPASAGHDGAVIVEHQRIESFAAHLPISKNHKEIRGRGTRHSAALGLSECSDALTVVVSEERGVVTVAERGRLVQMDTAAKLKDRIDRFLEDRFPQKLEANWKRFITHDVRWKLLALLLAVVAWLALAFHVEIIQTSMVVPIEYRNVPAAAEFDASTPAEALVTLSGSERAFRLLDRRMLKVSLDLGNIREGRNTVPITVADVQLPSNLHVDRIQPEEIQVQLKPPSPEEDDAPTPAESD